MIDEIVVRITAYLIEKLRAEVFCWKCARNIKNAVKTPWEVTELLQDHILRRNGGFFVCPRCGHARWMGATYVEEVK